MSTNSDCSIVLVHGRDFKPAEEDLRDICFRALRAGVRRDYPDIVPLLEDAQFDLAYYGDLTNAYLEGLGRRYDEQLDVGDRRNAHAALREIQPRKKFSIRQYDRVPGKSALREFAADMLAPLLGAIGLTMPLIRLVSRDCAEYLAGKTDYAEKVRERVRKTLCTALERDGRVMLITHGLGCIVAYDVLWELSHEEDLVARYGDRKFEAWVTLGAPLGDMHIRKYLKGADENLEDRFPTNVISWYNVAAEDDYTCHDNTLADDFKKMLHQRLVSVVHDYRIYNLAVRYGKSNPHSSVGYYIHPRVSKIVSDWLTSDRKP
jgi:hypothetical protein